MIARRKLLIALSADRVTVAHWGGRAITRHMSAPNSDEGLVACRDTLAAYRDIPVYVLVDAVEEDYRTDMLPHARGTDRRELVSRKLRQHYRNTPYCAAEWQGREAGGRRDDRYQFAALTNPDLVAPWLSLLEELGLPLAGVHLLPMAGTALVRKLALSAPHAMLVACTSGGLRLSYFRAGQFRLSRLTRFDDSAGSRAQFYVDEIANTRLYLHALQAAALDEPLAIVLLDPRDTESDAHRAIAAESPSLECVHVDGKKIGQLLKSTVYEREANSDLVFLHLLALGSPGYNLAPSDALVAHRTLQRRAAVYRACATTVAAGVAGCAYGAWQLHDTDTAIARAVAERLRHEEQYEAVTRSFPAAPAPAAALQQAVVAAQRLKADARAPYAAMRAVSRALAYAPDIAINEIVWKDGRHLNAPTSPVTQGEGAAIVGEVRPFTGDYRAAVSAIRAFADRLTRDAAVREVRLTRLPLNADPSVAIAGNTRDSSEPAGAAEFTVQILLKDRT